MGSALRCPLATNRVDGEQQADEHGARHRSSLQAWPYERWTLASLALKTLSSAEELASADPNSAYTLAYDAARFACASLLAQQGLRATSRGGLYAVQQAVIRQFGATFEPHGTMRRRRKRTGIAQFPERP